MPKNTACKVVMGFRSLDVTCFRISALEERRLRARVPVPHNAAAISLKSCRRALRACLAPWLVERTTGPRCGMLAGFRAEAVSLRCRIQSKAVPELTRCAGIKLNKRVSLR